MDYIKNKNKYGDIRNYCQAEKLDYYYFKFLLNDKKNNKSSGIRSYLKSYSKRKKTES